MNAKTSLKIAGMGATLSCVEMNGEDETGFGAARDGARATLVAGRDFGVHRPNKTAGDPNPSQDYGGVRVRDPFS